MKPSSNPLKRVNFDEKSFQDFILKTVSQKKKITTISI